MKFLGQGFQKLQHKQDRQTDTHTYTQTWQNALPAAVVGDNKLYIYADYEIYKSPVMRITYNNTYYQFLPIRNNK